MAVEPGSIPVGLILLSALVTPSIRAVSGGGISGATGVTGVHIYDAWDGICVSCIVCLRWPLHGVGSSCVSHTRPRMAMRMTLVVGAWCDMGRLCEDVGASAFGVVAPGCVCERGCGLSQVVPSVCASASCSLSWVGPVVCASADAVCHRWEVPSTNSGGWCILY